MIADNLTQFRDIPHAISVACGIMSHSLSSTGHILWAYEGALSLGRGGPHVH